MPRTPTLPRILDRRAAPGPVEPTRSRLDTLTALRALTAGRKIPSNKYQALINSGLVKVRGHGARNARF